MRKLIFIFTSVLFMAACNTKEDSSDLKLNNGEKWKVNEEMKPYIEQGNEILKDYSLQKNSDYHVLADNLKSQNDSLIKNCTMKGESHDELHKWLYPHIQLIGELSNANSSKEAETVVIQLDQSFKTYQNYFE